LSYPESVDVIILGGGAAGLMCAMTAARRGRKVLILEKSNRIGKKILMSGGGRCNFTNYSIEADNFLSDNPHFCKSALSRFTQWDFIKMVEKHGIAYEERKHQQLFCRESSKQILAMLKEECIEAGVTILESCETESIKTVVNQQKETIGYRARFSLDEHHHVITCHSLVIATGGLSVPTLGGSGMGYEIAEQFGLNVCERRAGLVPFMFTDDFKITCEALSGVSVEVTASCHGETFRESMLFTHRGISGPAILQISSYWRPGDTLKINLLPDEDAPTWLCTAKRNHGKSRLKTILQPVLPRALVEALQSMWWPEQAETPLAELSDEVLQHIGQCLNEWILKPSGTEGYRTAEVTLGGVDTSDVSSKTMEAKSSPGLFFIGEVLDVSGNLGGFNFQWAWSSGYAAGLYV